MSELERSLPNAPERQSSGARSPSRSGAGACHPAAIISYLNGFIKSIKVHAAVACIQCRVSYKFAKSTKVWSIVGVSVYRFGGNSEKWSS